MATTMGGEEARASLSEGTPTATLATVTAAGSPQVVPVPFGRDRDELVFTTSGSSQTAGALRPDPRGKAVSGALLGRVTPAPIFRARDLAG